MRWQSCCGREGGGLSGFSKESKGCSQKTSGRSYSLKHPVARHFVWPFLVQVVCRLQALQNTCRDEWQPCRNCAGRERITPALVSTQLVAKMRVAKCNKRNHRTPFSAASSSVIIDQSSSITHRKLRP